MSSNCNPPTNLKKKSRLAEHKQQRFDRLLPFAQRIISNRGVALFFLATAPFGRQLVAAGAPVTPGFGVAEFDACIALVKDAIGLAPLSDVEFEYALHLSTPPEYRETSQ